MKKLEKLAFDYVRCQQQVEELQTWLAGKEEWSEHKDVRPFFQAREQLAVLFGMFNPRISWADRIAWEFDIFGDFACDLAVGEHGRGEYCFVEFEDALSNSIFQKQGEKATREWGKKFDHGCSQIIDWAHKLDGLTPGNDLLARFDRHEINYEMVLVVGRDQHLDGGEKQRFSWRAEKVLVNNKKIFCMTFDQLLSQFSVRMKALADVAKGVIEAAKSASVTKPADPTGGDAKTTPIDPTGNAS